MCCLQISTTKLKTGFDTSGLEYQVFYYRLEVLLNFHKVKNLAVSDSLR